MKTNRVRRSSFRGCVLYAVILFACTSLPAAPASLVTTPSEEDDYGRDDVAKWLASHPASDDRSLVKRVYRMGRAVEFHIGDDHFSFVVAKGGADVGLAGEVRGFSNREIYVPDRIVGILNDSELAFLLGHEMAHVGLRHPTSVSRAKLLTPAPSADGVTAPTTTELDTRKDIEREADRYGRLYAYRAGFKLDAAESCLSKMQQLGGPESGLGHPSFSERIALLHSSKREVAAAVSSFSEGVAALRRGDSAAAISAFHRFVAEFPRDASAHLNLGLAYVASVRQSGVPADLAELIEPLPEPTSSFRAPLDLSKLEAARTEFMSVLRDEPSNVTALVGLALVALREDDYLGASARLREALEIDGTSAAAMVAMGNTKYLQSDFVRAADFYRQASAARPSWKGSVKNLALALDKLGNHDEAVLAWKSLQSDPQFGEQARQRLMELEGDATR